MISLLSIGDNFRQTLETCDSKNFAMHTQKHIRLMYCASTPPLSSFVFVCFLSSNPKFHVKLSNTLLYNYWKVARVAGNSVLIRLVFAKPYSKVSVLVGAHWERSWVLPVRLSMQRVTKRESKTAERPTAKYLLCTVLHCCLDLSLTCKVKVHCAWSESLWNNNSDMQTRKHQGWFTAFPLPPLSSSSVFVFEPKFHLKLSNTHFSESLRLLILEGGKSCWKQLFRTFCICTATF